MLTFSIFFEVKLASSPRVTIWGPGTPRRDFMYADDMADACVYAMSLPDSEFVPLLAANRNDGLPPVLNVGVGSDVTIAEVAKLVARTVGFAGKIDYDRTKRDGTPRKLMDSSRLNALGWSATTTLQVGLARAYEDFLMRQPSE